MKHPLIATPTIGDAHGLLAARIARRQLFAVSLAGAALATVPWRVWAQERVPTPRQTAGPFYPTEIPGDNDNDLVAVKGKDGIAKGEILLLAGTVMDVSGRPLPGARVEIWQCNAFGRYLHPADSNPAPLDPNFQGYGQFVTNAEGGYNFRTIKPVQYPGRTPHIHFRVAGNGIAPFVTQMYVAGEPGNARDGLLSSIRDERARRSVIVELARGRGGEALAGRFDIVLRV
jgi:protocatechuate 3,4-dioxygenase beta subunit